MLRAIAGARVKFDAQIGAAGTFLKFAKFHAAAAGDLYIMPPSPVGIHMSFHQSGQVHVRDRVLGIDIPVEIPTEEELRAWALSLVYEPPPTSQILLIQPQLDHDAVAAGSTPKKLKMDLGAVMAGMTVDSVCVVSGAELAAQREAIAASGAFMIDMTQSRWIFGGAPVFISFPADGEVMMTEMLASPIGKLLKPLIQAYEMAEAAGYDVAASFGAAQAEALELALGPLAEGWGAHAQAALVAHEQKPS